MNRATGRTHIDARRQESDPSIEAPAPLCKHIGIALARSKNVNKSQWYKYSYKWWYCR